MKRTVRLISIASSAVILSSAILAFSAEQITMGDSTKSATAATTATDTVKLKPQITCPIQGDTINKKLFVDYKGKRIYVCCEMCLTEVKKDPEKAIQKLKSLGQSVEAIAPVKKSTAAQKKPVATSDTSMKGMDMSKDTTMKGMDHSKK